MKVHGFRVGVGGKQNEPIVGCTWHQIPLLGQMGEMDEPGISRLGSKDPEAPEAIP